MMRMIWLSLLYRGFVWIAYSAVARKDIVLPEPG